MMYHKKTNILPWPDTLRAIATISVIFLHVSAPILYRFHQIPMVDWWIGNILDSCVRYCVPIFVMLTGTLVLSKEYELGYFIRNKFTRIFAPFLFWSVVYIIFNMINSHFQGQDFTIAQMVKYFFTQLRDGSSYHFWYIYMIIGLYLFIPIIGKWARNASEKELKYFISIWFVVMLLQQPYLTFIKPNVDFLYFTKYLGYLVLGYYLGKKPCKRIYMVQCISLLLIILGIGITAVGTYVLSAHSGSFRQEFYDYLSPNVCMVSIGIFLLFKNIHITNVHINRSVTFISTYSYGIYLVHVLVLSLLHITHLDLPNAPPIFYIPAVSIICLFISLGIIYLMNKMPYGKYIAG